MANQSSTSGKNKTVRNGTKASLGHLFGESTRKTGLDADWGQVHPDVLRNLVWGISELGGAVTLGTTKSGGAYTVKVYIGAPFDPLYFDGDDEGRASMAAWVDDLMRTVAEQA